MTEHAVRMGPWRSSLGVVTLPEAGRAEPDAPAVLLLNAGLLHHSGPHRLNVQLARRLARKGVASLRFDLSGIGDSGVRQDRMGRQESTVQETRDAMDHMAGSYGAKTFVLLGLCAGADQAVRTALEDERVVGTMLVDGYAYRTSSHLLHHYADRFLRPRSWWNIISLQHPAYSRLASRFRRAPAAPGTAPGTAPATSTAPRPDGPRLGVYLRPSREVADGWLSTLARRGCALFFAYTPSVHFNHRAQFREMFPSLVGSDVVHMEFFEQANHLFTLLANQAALSKQVESWMTEALLPVAASSAHTGSA